MTIIERLIESTKKLDKALKEADEWVESMDEVGIEGNVVYLHKIHLQQNQ